MIEELRDIHGLDTISWWPPPLIIWLLILLSLLLLALLILWLRQLYLYPPGSWRGEARKALRQLRVRQFHQTAKENASELSELLRRTAMARFGREKQASLSGTEWLHWLQQVDPNGFNWSKEGEILLSLPYAPPDRELERRSLEHLIDAALAMVVNSHEDYWRPKRNWFMLRWGTLDV